MTTKSRSSQAKFVWIDPKGRGRNVFALFRRTFRLTSVPRQAKFHLFGDSRYRLCVNGVVAGYGPARFFPSHPQFDSVDLAPWLQRGVNEITVEVNSFGASAFQAVPSVGGFIAWGKVGSIDLATPGDWQACRLTDRDPMAPPFSFAIGPTEIRDLRVQPEVWRKPVPVAEPQHWGALTPRPTPNLSLRERLPERLCLVAPVLQQEERLGYRVRGDVTGIAEPWTCFALTIHSPVAQEVTLGLFWAEHYLNGVELKRTNDEQLGNRQTAVVTLRAGKNFLYGESRMLQAGWSVMLGLPLDKGLRAESLQSTGPISVAELKQHRQKIPTSLAELPDFVWQPAPSLDDPAREMGWDAPGAPAPVFSESIFPIALPVAETGVATAVYDFGYEFLGHVMLDIEAPSDAVVDVANDEMLRPNGTLHLFKSNWGVNSADRFVLRGGGEQIEAFHPRGGRYLQVTVRNARGPVTLRRVSVRQTTTPTEVTGRFECSDPVLNWVWQVGRDSMLAQMEDSYLDCPWRERGTYLGDSLVEFHTHRLLTTELSIPRRALWSFALGQRTNGLLPPCTPSALVNERDGLGDFTLIWVLWLHDFWATTGDRRMVRELWPTVERIFASPLWKEAASGLWDADDMHVFTDWSATKESKRGENGVLNAFRYGALECAAVLAGVVGRPAMAARYTREARRVARAFQTLWNPQAGRFAAQKRGSQFSDEPALHANILALNFGLAKRAQVSSMLDYVSAGTAWTRQNKPGHVELYFFFYLLESLYRYGRVEVAERCVREVYGDLKQRGLWTLPETYTGGVAGLNSLCHAWGSGPSRFLIERTLGLRQARPGDLRNWILAPETATVTWARGAMPTPLGLIEVDWEQVGEQFRVVVKAPRGVRVIQKIK